MLYYVEENVLGVELLMLKFYWIGDIDMCCFVEVIGYMIDYVYVYYIEWLMVFGLFVMLLGVWFYDVYCWYMLMFWDVIDWVLFLNMLGMS